MKCRVCKVHGKEKMKALVKKQRQQSVVTQRNEGTYGVCVSERRNGANRVLWEN